MAKTVMQRVMQMIEEQCEVEPPLLRRILQIEQAYMSNDASGAKEEIASLIGKSAKSTTNI